MRTQNTCKSNIVEPTLQTTLNLISLMNIETLLTQVLTNIQESASQNNNQEESQEQ